MLFWERKDKPFTLIGRPFSGGIAVGTGDKQESTKPLQELATFCPGGSGKQTNHERTTRKK